MFACKFVGCRQIEYDVGSGDSESCTWRYGYPQILAYLYAEFEISAVCGCMASEEQVGAEGYGIVSDFYSAGGIMSLREPSFFIKLAVIREKRFRHHALNFSVGHDHRAVI